MLRRNTVTKIALVFSILLIILWMMLGTKASIAWFKQDDTIINILNFGEFDVELYYKSGGQYLPVDSTTKVFDDEALYEPGYTQVVYLKVRNAGTIDFEYDMTVVPDMESVIMAKNVYGTDIYLPNYLRCGFVFDSTEDGLMAKIADRGLAKTYATKKLSNLSDSGGTLPANGVNYCALILYMPEEVGNEANYRGSIAPTVDVGVGVVANQIQE